MKIIIIFGLIFITSGTIIFCCSTNQISNKELHPIISEIFSKMLTGKNDNKYFNSGLPDLNEIIKSKRIFFYSDIIDSSEISDKRVTFFKSKSEFNKFTNSSELNYINKDLSMTIEFDYKNQTITIDYTFGNVGGQYMVFKITKTSGAIKFKIIQHSCA